MFFLPSPYYSYLDHRRMVIGINYMFFEALKVESLAQDSRKIGEARGYGLRKETEHFFPSLSLFSSGQCSGGQMKNQRNRVVRRTF